jgi:hypothetical protein
MKLQFRDSAINIRSDADGDLDINADDEIELNSTLIDVNGNLDVSGTYAGAGLMTLTTASGENKLTVRADAASQQASLSLQVQADTPGQTVIYFGKVGATTNGQVGYNPTNDKMTFFTNNSEKMSLTTAGLLTITDDLVIKTGGTIGGANDTDLLTLTSGVLTVAGEVVGTGFTGTLDGVLGGGTPAAATTTTLASTTITASGIIKTDDTTAATSTTDGSLQTDGGLSVALDAVIGDDIIMISDAAQIAFGVNSEVTLTHSHDSGLILGRTATADDSFPIFSLATGDNDIASGDKLGQINWFAPNEGAGTDAIVAAASIFVGAEGDFSASNNASTMYFSTSTSGAPTERMKITSGGNIVFPTDGMSLQFGAHPADTTLTHVADVGLQFSDSDQLRFGAGGDLAIYHDGSNSYVDENGTGQLVIRSDQGILFKKQSADEKVLEATADGSVILYHNNGAKLETTATGANVNSLAIKTAGKESIWIPSSAMYPSTTNGCAAIAQVETVALRPDLKVLDFDASSDEFAQFAIAFPKSWNEGTVTFQPYWTVTGTNTGTVAWQLGACSVSSDVNLSLQFGTLVATTALAHSGTSNDLMISVESGAVTIAGSPAVDDQCFFQINRDVSADAQTGDARLLGLRLFFTTDAANDT